MKKAILTLTLLVDAFFLQTNSLFAQHQTFLDVELGKNTELFKYELKQKDFYESNEINYDCLYGTYLGVNCRVWIKEENYAVKELVINYRYDEWENLSYEKAKSMAEGVVKILLMELQENNKKYFVVEDTPILGTTRGTIIWLENGWYTIHIDGSWSDLNRNWMVFIRVRDEPDNAVYNYNLQQEKKKSKPTKTKH